MALVPAVLWGLDVMLREGRVAGTLGGGAALVALAMLEPQYTYLAAGLGLGHAAVCLVTGPRRGLRPAPVAIFGLLGLVAGGWVLMLRQAFVAGSIAEAGRRLEEVRLFSPVFGLSRSPRSGGGWPSRPWRSSAWARAAAGRTGGFESGTGSRSASGSC